jgi:hypothetical protein
MYHFVAGPSPKIDITQPDKKLQQFMDPLPFSQVPASAPYPEPEESIIYPRF